MNREVGVSIISHALVCKLHSNKNAVLSWSPPHAP